MKLYSRHSIVIAAAGGVAAGILSTWWIFNLKNPSKQTPSESSQDSALYQEVSAQDSELQEITPNLIQTSAPSAATTPSAYTTDEQQNIFVYEKCNEAVVNITTQVMGINWFLEPIVQDGGSGSGSIIDKRGYVVTNVHVISKANKITISLADGTSSNTPSTIPRPALRIGTTASFLPSIFLAVVLQMGVSISTSVR